MSSIQNIDLWVKIDCDCIGVGGQPPFSGVSWVTSCAVVMVEDAFYMGDTELKKPSLCPSSGHCAPPARSGHRCVADSANLYVFGGYNPDFDEAGGSENEDYPLFRELWRFHFATATWQQVRTEGYMPTELASMSGKSQSTRAFPNLGFLWLTTSPTFLRVNWLLP